LFKGVLLWCFTYEYILYFNQVDLLGDSPLPFLPSPVVQQLSVHFVMLFSCIEAMYFSMYSISSFSFLLLYLVSSNSPTMTNMSHICLICVYMYDMFIFVYMFIFWIFPPHMRQGNFDWACLALLTILIRTLFVT
jgi:hypothetical protein